MVDGKEEMVEAAGKSAGNPLDGVVAGTAETPQFSLPFMGRLSDADREALVARSCPERYAAGMVICQEGDPGDALYIVQQGQVAVLKELSDGRPLLLGRRGPGEILGEMSLVGEQPRFASLVAAEETDLLRIDAADFPLLMNSYPSISWAILNVLNDRLSAADSARASVIQEERELARRVKRLANEAEQQGQLAEMRQETMALIAHDLRTPLTVIDGCLQMLDAALSDEARVASGDIVGLAARSLKRLSSLVEALLGAARQDVAGVVLTRRPVDLVSLIDEAVRNVTPMAQEAEIRLNWMAVSDLPHLVGDAAKLDRVLFNLLENAVSYTPAGGRVMVAVGAEEDHVKVTVADSGPGVPPDYRESIFERFVRVPDVVGRHKGFGLGLYFCRQVVEAHGGRIWVEPGPGGAGSRFAFTLPIEEG